MANISRFQQSVLMTSPLNTFLSETTSDDEEDKDIAGLIQCSICLRTMDDPRALPCLHSFCYTCIQRLAHGDNIDMPTRRPIKCPMCKKSFKVPSSGLDGLLVSNFFVTTLKDRRSRQEKLIPCTSCDDSTQVAVARCLECKDFLCEKCHHAHKTVRVLKSHRVSTLKELKSGDVDFSSKPKEQFCEVHKGEILHLFCNTCAIPICKICSEEGHPSASHLHVDLSSSGGNHQDRIKELAEQCQQMSTEVDKAIDEVKKSKGELKESVHKVLDDIDGSAQQARAQMLMLIDERKAELEKSLMKGEMEQTKEIDKNLEELLFHQARLKTALDMVSEATSSSSFYATAELYSTLTTTLHQLANLKPAKSSQVSVPMKFTRFSSGGWLAPPLGYHTPRCAEELGTWVLLKHLFGNSHDINQGRAVVVHPSGDIAVADIGARRVHVYSKTGSFKHHLVSNPHSSTHGLAVSADGLYFVTGLSNVVDVFNTDGTTCRQFPAVSPSNKPSDQEETMLIGITVDPATQHVLVGDTKSKYISKHRQDGTHISSIQIDIDPWYIAVTPQSAIVVSSYQQHAVNMYNQDGTLLHNCPAPTGLLPQQWNPTGICIAHDLIFVNNFLPNSGVHCFCVLTGKYLGAIANMVSWGTGIATVEEDGRPNLLVSQGRWHGNETGVKVFGLE